MLWKAQMQYLNICDMQRCHVWHYQATPITGIGDPHLCRFCHLLFHVGLHHLVIQVDLYHLLSFREASFFPWLDIQTFVINKLHCMCVIDQVEAHIFWVVFYSFIFAFFLLFFFCSFWVVFYPFFWMFYLHFCACFLLHFFTLLFLLFLLFCFFFFWYAFYNQVSHDHAMTMWAMMMPQTSAFQHWPPMPPGNHHFKSEHSLTNSTTMPATMMPQWCHNNTSHTNDPNNNNDPSTSTSKKLSVFNLI